LLYDLPLTRSFRVLSSTAAFLVSVGLLVVWLPPDVCGFRPVLARGWHAASGYGVRSRPEAKQSPWWLGGTSNTAVVLDLRDCYHDQGNQHERQAPEDVV
jgi:hypothetical protein